MIFALVLLLLMLALALTLMRAGLGPTIWDRILAVNAFSSKILLLICVYLFASGHPEYVDIALLYALINYLATLALVRFFSKQGTVK